MAFDLVGRRNVGDAFLARAASHPDRTALTIYRGSAAAEHIGVSYGELIRRAGLRAAALRARLEPGDRVLIALPTCVEFVECYVACLLAGLVAVPAPPPGGSSAATERVVAIAADCAPRLAIIGEGEPDKVAARLRELGIGDLPIEEPGDAGPGDAPPLAGTGPTLESLAVLQYSSGSTGTPKGVMLSHGNVLANIRAIGEAGYLTDRDVLGAWLPLHHDMGLFALLTAGLLHGGHIVLMPPSDFLRRPVEWFRMMSRFRVSFTAAPSFAYDLCRRLISDDMLKDVDLSSMRLAINGSEPIHVATMAEFTARFGTVGLRDGVVSACYGLAENTVFVSNHTPLAPPRVITADQRRLEAVDSPAIVPAADGNGKEIISVGPPGGAEIRIVDPATRRPLPDGAIGEIWLRGPSVGRGYWNRADLNAEIFAARLAGDDDGADRSWLRTGDLGATVDGVLFVTGRLKEMLIVHGRNLFPHDVEQQARAAHEGLVGFVGAAFGVAVPDERIVLIHEVNPKVPVAELPGIAAAVKRRLTVEAGVSMRNILLVRRGTVRRTTSGKIRRAEMRERFLAGQIDAVLADLDADVRRVLAGDAV